MVFSFPEALDREDDFRAPEPDFLKWLDKALGLDVMISGDEAAYDKLTPSEREAWGLYCRALEAIRDLFDLYKDNLPLFQKLAGQMMFLPALLSRHPDSDRFNRHYLQATQLGYINTESCCQPNPQHLARQSWPVRYAYAIIETIDLTLDTYGERLPIWAQIYGYGEKHLIPMARFEEAANKLGWNEARKRLELPHYVGSYDILPCWTEGLETLRRPFNANHLVDYWRVGKAMVLEELRDFHERPEWQEYHRRRYANGAKAGTIQHAIFKDILIAMRTIAGANKRRQKRSK